MRKKYGNMDWTVLHNHYETVSMHAKNICIIKDMLEKLNCFYEKSIDVVG